MKRTIAYLLISLFLLQAMPTNAQGYAGGSSGIFFLEGDFATPVQTARGTGEVVFIGVRDGGFTSDTMTVSITSTDPDFGTNMEQETVTLVRFAPGNYRGVVGFETAATSNNGKVHVADGSVVVGQYAGSSSLTTLTSLTWRPAQTAIVTVDADHYGADARIKVTVRDMDENQDPFAREAIPYWRVLLRSDSQMTMDGPANRDFLALVAGIDPVVGAGLYETGRNSGIFEGHFFVETAYDGNVPAHVNHVANPNAPPSSIPEARVYVEDMDRIAITYMDNLNAMGREEEVETSTTWHRTHSGSLKMFNDPTYAPSGMVTVGGTNSFAGLQSMHVRVVDMDKRGSGNLQVRVGSSSTGETGIVQILTETGSNSGEFIGAAQFSTTGATGLKVKHGDKLFVSYVDDRDGSGLAGTGNVFPDGGLNCGSPGLSKNDPAYYGQPCIFWVESADATIQFITSADLDPGAATLPDDTAVSQLSGQLGQVEASILVMDPGNQGSSIDVRITSDLDPFGFDLTLPIGDDGHFRGTFTLQGAGPDGFPAPVDASTPPFILSDADAATLYVQDGSTIMATYVDNADVNGEEKSVGTSITYQATHTGMLYIEKANANGAADTVDVYLYDPDLNTGPAKDSIKVTVTSSASPFPGIQLNLDEMGDVTHRNTGLFKGTLHFSTAAAGSLTANTVRVPDSTGVHTVTVSYADAFNGMGVPDGSGRNIYWQKSSGALEFQNPVYVEGTAAFTLELFTAGLTSPQVVTLTSLRDDGSTVSETDTVSIEWVAGTKVATKLVTFAVDGAATAADGKLVVNGDDLGRQSLIAVAGTLSTSAEFQAARDPVGVNGANFARSVFDARECTDADGLVIPQSRTGTPVPDWPNPTDGSSPPEIPYPAIRATGNGAKQICIQITDPDQNKHNGVIDLIHAEVTVKGLKERVSLLEVEPTTGMPDTNSNTFRGFIGFDQAASVAGDSVFQVQNLDTVLIQYTDPTSPGGTNGPSFSKVVTWFSKSTGTLELSRYSTFNSTATSFEGAGRVYVRVMDNDHNTRGTVPDTLTVQVCSETECGGFMPGAGNGWETITLFETGQSTGIFTGSVELVDASSSLFGVAQNGRVDVNMQDERILVTYSDDTRDENVLYRGGNEEELKAMQVAQLNWIKTVSARASQLCRDEFCSQPILNDVSGKPVFGLRNVWLEVTDDDRFADVSVNTDTVNVRVVSDSDRTGINVELTETFGRSGVFRGILGFTNKESVPGSKIAVAHGDSFTIHYDQPSAVNSAGGPEDVVVIGDGIWRDGELGSIDVLDHYYVGSNDPFTQFEDSLAVTINDPDRNVLGTVRDALTQKVNVSDPFSPYQSSVIVRSDSDWDGFRYDYTLDCNALTYFCETDLNSGQFEDVLGFVQGISDSVTQRISVSNRDKVYIDYIDPQDFRGREQVVTKEILWFESHGTGWIDIQDRYATESAVMNVVVRDQGLNKNSGATEAAHVWACSDSDSSCELVTLSEARRDDFTKPGLFSNTFVGSIGFETSFTPRNGKLFVRDGDTVMLYYADANENLVRGSSNPSDPNYYLDFDSNPVPAAVIAYSEWVLVDNTAPTATLQATPTTVTGDSEIVTFTLTGMDDGRIDSWELDFGDGTVLMSDRENVDLMDQVVTVTHKYSNGTSQLSRQATLTVTDDGGLEGSASKTITVLARPTAVVDPGANVPTPTDIAKANADGFVNVRVTRTSEGNVVTWVLPTTTFEIVGVQIHRSDDDGATFTTIADIPKSDPRFAAQRYVDSDPLATKKSAYVVTFYYANDVGKAVNGVGDIPGFGAAGARGVAEESDSGLPWWVWLVMAIMLVLLVAGVVVAIVLRQSTSHDEWDDDGLEEGVEPGEQSADDVAATLAARSAPMSQAPPMDTDDPDEEAEGMDEPATSEEVHHIKCPQCSTGFTASGSKPLAINCPGCGAKGMLR